MLITVSSKLPAGAIPTAWDEICRGQKDSWIKKANQMRGKRCKPDLTSEFR